MLKGKTALITGSTQDLGLAIAERLASHGCTIVMNGLGAGETIEANQDGTDRLHSRVALETAAQNITCNAICPGSSPTPAIEQRLEDFMAKEKLPREQAIKVFMGSRQPSGRFVSPERVAGLVAFLCGPDGADTTGSAISIDGGWSAA